jgi:ParB family chromosome partitioning protein
MATETNAQPCLFSSPGEIPKKIPSKHKKQFDQGKCYNIPIDTLKPDNSQPRTHFDNESLHALAESVKQHGIIQPVLFRVDEHGEKILVAGQRRWQAALIAGLKMIPALYTEENHLEVSLVENLLREDLTVVELAEALGRLHDNCGYSVNSLSTLIGKAPSTTSEIVSINRLPLVVRDACRNDPHFPRDILVEIAKAETDEWMIQLYNEYMSGSLDRKGLKQSIRKKPKPGQSGGTASVLSGFAKKISVIQFDLLTEPDRENIKPLLQQTIEKLTAMWNELYGGDTSENPFPINE